MELKRCPFCGKEAELVNKVKDRGSNRTGNIPEGAVLVQERKSAMRKTIYYWERRGYSVHCSGVNCICRTVPKAYNTKEEAITAWNTRYSE